MGLRLIVAIPDTQKGSMRKTLFAVVLLAGIVVEADKPKAKKSKYEVWSIDQSNSPGKTFGGTLYIWDGRRKVKVGPRPREK